MMSYSFALPKGAETLAEIPSLSKEARLRLAWMDFYRTCGNAALTCRHFGISRQCFHAWRKRYDPFRLESLESKSRRPLRTRSWEVSRRDEFRILRLRRAHLRWGKMKLAVLYAREYGTPVSSWKIQRVIEKHRLYFHPRRAEALRRNRRRNEAKTRITELRKEPRQGYLVAFDGLTRYWAGTKRAIFTAIDVHSKIAFARMYPSKASCHAADFLRRVRYLCDGNIEHLQTDNGSEFQGLFRATARVLCIPQYYSRVKTPTDNPFDERFNRTLQDEFIAMGHMTSDCVAFNRHLTDWLIEYNFRRPHQALSYAVPVEYHYRNREVSPMYPSSTAWVTKGIWPACLQ